MSKLAIIFIAIVIFVPVIVLVSSFFLNTIPNWMITFPFEDTSTYEQFYDEPWFEAYR